MRLEPFRAEHLVELHHPVLALPGAFAHAAQCAAAGFAYSGRASDGHLIGAAGVTLTRPGIGEAWAAFGPDLQRYPMAVHRAARRILRQIAAAVPLRRVQATVDPADPVAVRWITRLGFTCEAPALRQFGPAGETMALYAWLPGGQH